MGGGKGGSQTIGLKYFMKLHMAVCHGPVTAINQIYVGERSLEIAPATINSSQSIFQPNLFGGEKKEGGIVGDIDFEFGANDQTVNASLESSLGTGQTPAFRGTTCVVFRKSTLPLNQKIPGFDIEVNGFVTSGEGGFLTAISPYPKPWAFEVLDIPGGTFNPTKQIVNGSANGGHIIYDCLTNSDWGLGLPEASIDLPSFTEVTNVLFDEGLGLSFIYSNQSTIEEFIKEVLNHINGILYTDRLTGNFKLVLIRDDYDVESLQVFDETNIVSLSNYERATYSNLINEIVLTYQNQGAFEKSTISVQDLASVQAQGEVVSQTLSFLGIDDPDNANLIALRELRQRSTPLSRVRIRTNREAYDIAPGDVIKLAWQSLGIESIIFRVVSVSYGTLENGIISLELVEDIFGLPESSYLVPEQTTWTDEVVAPLPSPNSIAFELPYFVIETTFSQAEINELLDSSSLYQAIAQFPAIATFGFELRTRTGVNDFVEVANGDFSPTCQLAQTLDRIQKVDISIKNFTGGLDSVVVGGYAYLNNEVLRITEVDLQNNQITIGRGYLDTIPQAHSENDIIYFADSNSTVDPTIYEEFDVVDGKALTQTSAGLLLPDDAQTNSVTMVGRRAKPYNAAQIRINSTYFIESITDVAINVTWTHQDRTQQLVTGGSDWYEIDLGSQETDVEYTVRLINNDTDVLIDEQTGITTKSYTFTPLFTTGTTTNVRLEVLTTRNSIQSLQTFTHVFEYITS